MMKFFGLSPSTAFSLSVLLTEYIIMSHMQQFHTKEMHLDQHTDFILSKKFHLKIGILPVVPDFHYLVQRNFQRHHFTRLPTSHHFVSAQKWAPPRMKDYSLHFISKMPQQCISPCPLDIVQAIKVSNVPFSTLGNIENYSVIQICSS